MINFPANPSLNQLFTFSNKTWQWDGDSWTKIGNQSNIVINFDTSSKANIADLTTANVAELTNLYFTNARAVAAFSAGQNITLDANGRINSTATSGGGGNVNSVNGLTGAVVLSTANIAENGSLYFTNARVYSNVLQLGYITASSLNGYATNAQLASYALDADLTTANVAELTNLYFTNARVYSNVTQLGYITNSSLSGYATNSQLLSYATTGNLDLKANTSDLTTSNVTELTNLYFTNTRVYSNVIQLGYITGSSLTGYATNNQLTSYATISNLALKANIVDLTTANVNEVTNLYFTNARAVAAVVNTTLSNITLSGPISGLGYSKLDLAAYGSNTVYLTTTDDDSTALFMGLVSADLYAHTTVQIRANTAGISHNWTFGADGSLTFPDSNVQTTAFTTSDAYSDTKVYSNVTQLGYITSSALSGYATNSQLSSYATNAQITAKANIADLNTSNIAEGANLYFTNARVVSALTSVIPTINAEVSTSVTEIFRFDRTLYRGGKALITLSNSPNFKIEELLFLHDGTNVYINRPFTGYSQIDFDVYTGNIGLTYSANIVGSNVIVYGAAVSGNVMTKGIINYIIQ
jgi:hypothetical protein